VIIPAIDLIGGRVVRLLKGDYGQKTEYSWTPQERYDLYVAEGARQLHLVDLDGAKDPSKRQQEVIGSLIRNTPVPVQVGGGIRSESDVADLLAAGASRVVIGSLAVREPDLVGAWMAKYGPEHIVLALDVNVRDGKRLIAVSGWQQDSGVTIEEIIRRYQDRGLRHVLCTDISRDGTLRGSNVDLYRDLSREYPDIAFQASGGIGSLADVEALKGTGVSGVILGRSLLEGKLTVKEAVACWQKE
jgi:phosphoribosylformimino-5-aminoimidazole carboxamide ribotide isomerase